MDLKSGYPYWAVKDGLLYAFPQLDANLSCFVAVVGAGITGALIADGTAGHGHDLVVLDQCDVCWGSTSASTALLQYEIDTHAIDLARHNDQASALLAYQTCLRAISGGAAARALGDVDFAKCESLYYVSQRADHPRLADESAWRKQYGFLVRWLKHAALKGEYSVVCQ